jgi:peptidoglycan hydrolase-like protein with peptidoglycan-binding domain
MTVLSKKKAIVMTPLKVLIIMGSLLSGGISIAHASEKVSAIQNKLNELGFDAGVADGIWGKNTKNALIPIPEIIDRHVPNLSYRLM